MIMADSMEGVVKTDGSPKDENLVDGVDSTDQAVSGKLHSVSAPKHLALVWHLMLWDCLTCANRIFLQISAPILACWRRLSPSLTPGLPCVQ